MDGTTTKPQQLSFPTRRSVDYCSRCRKDFGAEPWKRDPRNQYFRMCSDESACHARVMRPKLTLLPGGARY